MECSNLKIEMLLEELIKEIRIHNILTLYDRRSGYHNNVKDICMDVNNICKMIERDIL